MKKTLILLSMISLVTTAKAQVSFDHETTIVNENAGTATITLNLTAALMNDVTVTVSPITGGNASASDFTFAAQTVTIPETQTTATFTVPITDNSTANADKFFVLELSNPVGTTLGSVKQKMVYILDNENHAPVSTTALNIQHVSSFEVSAAGSAEITAFDPVSKRLFVVNSTETKLEVLDMTNPAAMSKINTVDMSAYGTGATSVAFKNGIVAVTVDGANYAPGKVIFMDINGANVSSVDVGVLPDMITFTPDGTKVIIANEGEPAPNYTQDPEGTISVVNVSGGLGNITQANVTNINFNAFDSQLATLRSQGVRIFGTNATVSKDFEPEYITVSDDNTKAWVTLQENNAIAVLNLLTNTVTQILPLGVKDHSLPQNSLDASDNFAGADAVKKVFMSNWPIKGLYLPDAIASYNVGGQTYLITANEGDAREWGTFVEEVRVGHSSYVLDPTVFPNAAILKKNNNLGRLQLSKMTGDTDGDGDFDEIHALGSRSFSIWNATTGQQVFDSGDDLERIIKEHPVYGSIFNASNDANSFKNRSDNKGPEPEGVTVAQINGQHYAFVTLERIGGFVVYNVTNPANATFVNYFNNRSATAFSGDQGPEGIIYIKPEESSTGKGLIVISNEISATVSVYEILNNVLSTAENYNPKNLEIAVYPNPASENLNFTLPNSATAKNVEIHNMAGQKVLSAKANSGSVNISNLAKGSYIIRVFSSKGVFNSKFLKN